MDRYPGSLDDDEFHPLMMMPGTALCHRGIPFHTSRAARVGSVRLVQRGGGVPSSSIDTMSLLLRSAGIRPSAAALHHGRGRLARVVPPFHAAGSPLATTAHRCRATTSRAHLHVKLGRASFVSNAAAATVRPMNTPRGDRISRGRRPSGSTTTIAGGRPTMRVLGCLGAFSVVAHLYPSVPRQLCPGRVVVDTAVSSFRVCWLASTP